MKFRQYIKPLVVTGIIALAGCDNLGQARKKPEQQVSNPDKIELATDHTRNKIVALIADFENQSPSAFRGAGDTQWQKARNALDFAKDQGLDTAELENRLNDALLKHYRK